MAVESDSQAMASKYPFLAAAKKFLSTAQVTGESLQKASDYCLMILQKQPVELKQFAQHQPSPSAIENYAVCRLLLAQAKNSFYAEKFALATAKISAERMKKESDEEIEKIASEFLPSISKTQGKDAQAFAWNAGFAEFLNAGGKLVNAHLSFGRVFLSRQSMETLLQKAIENKIKNIPSPSPNTPPQVQEQADELSAQLQEYYAQQQYAPATGALKGGYSGKFLSLPCVSAAMQGTGEGKRYYGSMAVAIACLKDGLSKEQAAQAMAQYVEHCAKTAHDFTLREALASMDWVYKHKTMGFSCKMIRDQGLAGSENQLCNQCPLGRKYKAISKQ